MPTIRLTHAVNAWGSTDFSGILKREIERMDAQQLPLQQGLVTGSVAISDTLSATILSAAEEAGFIRVKAGIFYSGIIRL